MGIINDGAEFALWLSSTTAPVGDSELSRLEHLRDLVPADRSESMPGLLLLSRTGFTRELRRSTASRTDVGLIDLDRLYRGS
jgi:uncharacterized protein